MDKEQIIFSHTDIYEVLSGTYPNTANRIRISLLNRVGMVFGENSKDHLALGGSANITPKNRSIKYDDMHYFVGEVFGEYEQKTLELENVIMGDLRKEAEQIYETAKKVCELTKKNFSEVIGFLLENGANHEQENKSEVSIHIITDISTETIDKQIHLSDEKLKEIRDYVGAGNSNDDKKQRRLEMADKFNVSVRHIGSITSWTKKWEKKPKISTQKTVPEAHAATTADKHISKREALREYLEEFFEGNILPPKACGISYKDMHDCFCKDTNMAIDYGEVPKIWQAMIIEKQGSTIYKEKSTERRLQISLVKSGRKLESGEFVIDKSYNVLLPNEVKEILEA